MLGMNWEGFRSTGMLYLPSIVTQSAEHSIFSAFSVSLATSLEARVLRGFDRDSQRESESEEDVEDGCASARLRWDYYCGRHSR